MRLGSAVTSILLISCVFSFAMFFSPIEALIINEVFPNPLNESNEWVEIYNPLNENINLSEWMIGDENSNDTISHEFSKNTNSTYFLIVGQNSNISEITNVSVEYFRTDGEIGNGLRNMGENIRLYKNSALFDNVSYPNFNSHEEQSWSRMDNGNWNYSQKPTPGLPNICAEEMNQTTNQTNTTENACDMSIRIESEEIFAVGKSNSFRLVVKNLNGTENAVEVEYWIEDFFGNILKPKTKTNNTATVKSWTPPALTGTEGYKINAIITDAKCNDTNVSNNHAEKIIVVEGDTPVSDSSISIIDAGLGSDGKARFGDEIEVMVNIYKGDTAKNAVEMRIEDTEGRKAGKTTFNIYTKFSNYTISVPLQISPNCDGVLPNGTYFIKIEGFNGSDEKQITIEGSSGSFCKIKTIETAKPCSSSACPPCQKTNNSEKPNEVSKDFEIISCSDEIAKNAELAIKLLLKAPQEKNFTVYSYIYDGNKPLSLGFNGKKWLNTWNANKVEVTARNSTTVDLKNRISNDTEPGRYKLRIKIIYDGKEHDITRDILVKEPSEEMQQKTSGQESEQTNETLEKENATNNKNENLKEKQIKTPTGSLVSKKEDNWFSAAINGVINFFKNLFKL